MSWSGQDRPQTDADPRSGLASWHDSPPRPLHPARIDFLDTEDPSPFAPQPQRTESLRSELDDLAGALERLIARRGEGTARPAARRAPAEPPRPAAGPQPVDPRVADHFHALAAQIDTLRLTQDRSFQVLRTEVTELRALLEARSGIDPVHFEARLAELAHQITVLAADLPDRHEFMALGEAVADLRGAVDGDGTRTALAALSEGQARLAARLDDVARVFAESSPAGALAEIGARLDALDARQIDPARLGEIAERLDRLAENGLDTPVAAALAERVGLLAAGLETAAGKADVTRLEQGHDRLAALIENLGRTVAAEAEQTAAATRAGLAEIRARLDGLDAGRTDPALLAALAERLEEIGQRAVDGSAVATLTERVSALAADLGSAARKADVERVERGNQRLAALLEKVSLTLAADTGQEADRAAALATLAEQTAALRTRMDRFDPALAGAVTAGVEALDRLADHVRRSVREARESAAGDMAGFARRLEGFEARLAPDPGAGAAITRLEAAITGLRQDIATLAERTSRTGPEAIAERLSALDSRVEQAEERAARNIRRKVDEHLQALSLEIRARADKAAATAPAADAGRTPDAAPPPAGPPPAARADGPTVVRYPFGAARRASLRAAGATPRPETGSDAPVPAEKPGVTPFAMTADDAEDRTSGPATMKLRAELRRLRDAAEHAAPVASGLAEADEPATAAPSPAPRLGSVPEAGDLIAAARRAARPLQRGTADAPATSAAPPPAERRPPVPRRAAETDPAAGPAVYPAQPIRGAPSAPPAGIPASPAPAAPSTPVTEALAPLVGAVRASADAALPPRSGWRLPGHRTLLGATAAAAVVSGAAYLATGRLATVTVTPDGLVADRNQLAADIARLAERQQAAGDPETTGSIIRAPDAAPAPPLVAPTLTAPALTAPQGDMTAGTFRNTRPAAGTAPAPAGPAPDRPAPADGTPPATATPPDTGRKALAATAPGAAAAPGAVPAVALPDPLPPAPGLVPRPVLPREIGPLSLRSAAGNGDPLAAHEVALRYLDGHGVPADPALALAWFHRAAEAGSVAGVFRVASMYEKGIGVPASLRTAAEWYRVAADAGNVKAMHNLAVLLSEGALGERDFSAAARWFEQAAERGLADSQYNIGVLYAQGVGVGYDLPAAWRWFALAAAQGDQEAAEQRDLAAERLDGAELANARAALKVWRPLPADPAANSVPPANPGWLDPGTAT